MKKLSLVILTYNSETDIFECLDSIYEHNDLGDALEIIVIDNNSAHQKDLQMVLSKKYPDVVFYGNTDNRGYGAGNNIGIRMAQSDYILIMNPDVRMRRLSFKKIVDCYDKDSTLGIMGFTQYESLQQERDSLLLVRPSFTSFVLMKLYQKLNLYSSRLFCFSGACFSMRRQAFESVGFFNENNFLYGEERYLQLQMLRGGKYQGKFCADMSFIHPLDNRPHNSKIDKLSIESYIQTLQLMDMNVKQGLRGMLNYNRFFLIKNFIKGRDTLPYKKKISLIKEYL